MIVSSRVHNVWLFLYICCYLFVLWHMLHILCWTHEIVTFVNLKVVNTLSKLKKNQIDITVNGALIFYLNDLRFAAYLQSVVPYWLRMSLGSYISFYLFSDLLKKNIYKLDKRTSYYKSSIICLIARLQMQNSFWP